jgi:hypothetical protein
MTVRGGKIKIKWKPFSKEVLAQAYMPYGLRKTKET